MKRSLLKVGISLAEKCKIGTDIDAISKYQLHILLLR